VTISKLQAADSGRVLSVGLQMQPNALLKAPPDHLPSVSIVPFAGRPVAGAPVTITVNADAGAPFVWILSRSKTGLCW
jgi:hypothetical protein